MADIAKAVFRISVPDSLQHCTGNKAVVLRACEAFWRGDIEAGLGYMTDDATMFVPGAMKTSGLYQGKDAVRTIRQMTTQTIFREADLEIVGLYSDDDTVVLELLTKAVLTSGHAYDQQGCSVWKIRDGKICAVREYIDTQKAMAVNATLERR
jgi:ketosteroid isomerase-like protein